MLKRSWQNGSVCDLRVRDTLLYLPFEAYQNRQCLQLRWKDNVPGVVTINFELKQGNYSRDNRTWDENRLMNTSYASSLLSSQKVGSRYGIQRLSVQNLGGPACKVHCDSTVVKTTISTATQEWVITQILGINELENGIESYQSKEHGILLSRNGVTSCMTSEIQPGELGTTINYILEFLKTGPVPALAIKYLFSPFQGTLRSE